MSERVTAGRSHGDGVVESVEALIGDTPLVRLGGVGKIQLEES